MSYCSDCLSYPSVAVWMLAFILTERDCLKQITEEQQYLISQLEIEWIQHFASVVGGIGHHGNYNTIWYVSSRYAVSHLYGLQTSCICKCFHLDARNKIFDVLLRRVDSISITL